MTTKQQKIMVYQLDIKKSDLADAQEILSLQKQAYYQEAVINNNFEIPPLT